MSNTETSVTCWALQFRNNKIDGETRYFVRSGLRRAVILFRTREEAREYAAQMYGYIKDRNNGREPHGWCMPKPVCVKLEEMNYQEC